MSSALCLPRCSHRVANTKLVGSLVALLAGFLSYTTASVSLHGQELLDYRLVVPAGHMQPWPDDKADILIDSPAAIRIATKWRTNLSRASEKTTQPDVKATAPAEPAINIPAPVVTVPSAEAEVVAPPTAPEPPAPTTEPEPVTPSNARGCYAAPPLTALSTRIAVPDGTLPTDVAALCATQIPPTGDRRVYGAWAGTDYHWAATCMHHRPLYFEEINAERYGYTVSYAFQPVISAARFFAAIPALPYKMVVERPRDCIYTLGHYRPGSCVPRRCNRIPWSLGGSAVETGVIAGLILLIP